VESDITIFTSSRIHTRNLIKRKTRVSSYSRRFVGLAERSLESFVCLLTFRSGRVCAASALAQASAHSRKQHNAADSTASLRRMNIVGTTASSGGSAWMPNLPFCEHQAGFGSGLALTHFSQRFAPLGSERSGDDVAKKTWYLGEWFCRCCTARTVP
jgi:hypothetical protein